MKALVVPAAGRLEIREIPQPQVGPYDALVKIEVCGICNSTDHKLIVGQMYWAPPFPFVLGHESVGRVVEVGAKVRKFKPGDRVTRPLAFWPGSRKESQRGRRRALPSTGWCAMVRRWPPTATRRWPATTRHCGQNVVPPHLSAGDAALAISLAETASVCGICRICGAAACWWPGPAWWAWPLPCGSNWRAGPSSCWGAAPSGWKWRGAWAPTRWSTPTTARYLAAVTEAAAGLVDGIIEATGDAALAGELLAVLKPDGFACAYGVPPTGVSYAPRWQTANVEEHLAYEWWPI